MKTVLTTLALLCALYAAALGFGWVSEYADDWGGWIGLGLAFFFAAHLPLERS